jgi:hypothetical protein
MAEKIKVLQVPDAAYDPGRPVSNLLKSQIRQLQIAVFDAVDSEAEASDCIRTLNQLLVRLRPQVAPQSHRALTAKKKKQKSGAKKKKKAAKKR